MLINRAEMQDFLPLLVRLQDEPIADNVCIPLYFLAKLVRDSGTTVVQVGEGADENFLGYWWCEHYRQKAEKVYDPARRGPNRGGASCFKAARARSSPRKTRKLPSGPVLARSCSGAGRPAGGARSAAG